MADQAHLFTTIGHHTFENRGVPGDIPNAPYFCREVNAFLGRGFYFWEDNLPFAKHWGGIWYIDKGLRYYVGEVDISCSSELFFDLVGNRDDQKFFKIAVRILASRRAQLSSWPIGKIIEFLKAASKDPDDEFHTKFDYMAIRAADNSSTRHADIRKFAESNASYADLNPCYIICVTVRNEIISTPVRVVYTANAG